MFIVSRTDRFRWTDSPSEQYYPKSTKLTTSEVTFKKTGISQKMQNVN